MATNGDPPVTPDEVRQEFDLVEQIGQRIGVDDNYLAALLAQGARMERLEQTQVELLRQLSGEVGPTVVGEFPVDMSHEVPMETPKSDPYEVTRVPDEQAEARITAATLGWQSGTQNAVGIQLRTGNGLKLVPRNPEDDYLAFDGFTETFDLTYTLNPGEELVARTVNFDDQNDHFVNVVPHIEEVVEE